MYEIIRRYGYYFVMFLAIGLAISSFNFWSFMLGAILMLAFLELLDKPMRRYFKYRKIKETK